MCRDVQGVFCQFIVEHRIHRSWLHRRIAHQSDWSRTSTDNLCSTTLVSHLSCHLLHSTFDGASAFILSATQRPFLEFHRLPTPCALCPLPEVNHNGLIPLSTQALAVPRVSPVPNRLVSCTYPTVCHILELGSLHNHAPTRWCSSVCVLQW